MFNIIFCVHNIRKRAFWALKLKGYDIYDV